MEYRIEYIDPFKVMAIWDEIEPLVERLLRKTSLKDWYDVVDVRSALLLNQLQLFIGVGVTGEIVALGITTFNIYPKCKQLVIFGFVTKYRDCLSLDRNLDWFMEFGEANGCNELYVTGRRGWRSFWRSLGFTNETIAMRLKLWAEAAEDHKIPSQ